VTCEAGSGSWASAASTPGRTRHADHRDAHGRAATIYALPDVFRYRLHDTDGDDVGELQHPAPNLEPGDTVTTEGRQTLAGSQVRALA
jgi:hypothetical protein